MNDVRDRQQLLLLHKKAKKSGFDLAQYNLLRDQIAKLEFDLKRLRDPLKLRLPPKTAPQATTSTSLPPTPMSLFAAASPVKAKE